MKSNQNNFESVELHAIICYKNDMTIEFKCPLKSRNVLFSATKALPAISLVENIKGDRIMLLASPPRF